MIEVAATAVPVIVWPLMVPVTLTPEEKMPEPEEVIPETTVKRPLTVKSMNARFAATRVLNVPLVNSAEPPVTV